MDTTKAYILLGSDMGERIRTIEAARKRIEEECGRITKCSSLYESEPWGFKSETMFVNQVIVIETVLTPFELLDRTMQIEKSLGRKRNGVSNGYSSRTIDIDILFFGKEQISTERLTVPHPRITQRRFTLVPLAEISPRFIHPTEHKTTAKLLKECPDKSAVEKI